MFSPAQMEEDLRAVISAALAQGIPVKDICFSGNGEPTMSRDFPEALKRAGEVRASFGPLSWTKLVLITNGTFLLEENLFSLLCDAARVPCGLEIWLKLDAGTPGWYKKMSRSALPFEKLIEKMRAFCDKAPVTIQTMLCAVDGEGPPPEEEEAWQKLVCELSGAGNIRKVQIYGKARASPEDPKAAPLPIRNLAERALSLRQALAAAVQETSQRTTPDVEIYP